MFDDWDELDSFSINNCDTSFDDDFCPSCLEFWDECVCDELFVYDV